MIESEPAASYKAALCQLSSGDSLEENLAAAADALDEAAAAGAAIACLPELWPCMSADPAAKLAVAEGVSGPAQYLLAAKAAEHSMHVMGGSVPRKSAEPGRIFNSCLLYGPDGVCIARYDKMHLFRFSAPDRTYDETETCVAGDKPVVAETSLGRICLSVCYDLRFPELYRAVREPPDLIVVPSAFTVQTGQAHWETLIRARAIENLCPVLAPAQCGTHAGGLRTWGHSLAAGPWGEILADGGEEPGVCIVQIEPNEAIATRKRLPALSNRGL